MASADDLTVFTPVPPPIRLNIRFPQRGQKNVAQTDEWCEIVDGDIVTSVRFHDYAKIFSIPHLYNQLFGGPNSETKCVSPQVMVGLLRAQLHRLSQPPSDELNNKKRLRFLDLGAGNGMVGDEIRTADPTSIIVGFDILPEARAAAERDRPGVYNAYVAADISEYVRSLGGEAAGDADAAVVFARGFDVLISVSALAFGDATASAVRAAASLVDVGGLVVFNIKEELFDPESTEGSGKLSVASGGAFSALIRRAVDQGSLEIVERKRYCHRYSVTGEPIFYVAVVAIKRGSLG